MEENLREVFLDSEKVYDGSLLHVRKDTVRLPNGKEANREVIRHIGAVCVVPVTQDGQVIVERQFRYPMDQVITEIPAGKLDRADEDPLEAGKRELEEETGYIAGKWTDMGVYYPTPAYSDEKIWMYLAEDLSLGQRHLDDDEFLDVKLVPLKTLIDEILSGKIPDGKTQTALMKAYLLLSH